MATHSNAADRDFPRFSFGSMALTEETGRSAAQTDPISSLVEGDAPVTLNEALDAVKMVSVNEHFCPEILPYHAQTVDEIQRLVAEQTEEVDAEEDENGDALSFESQLKRMEIDRINYMLRDYLRVRLKKIERYILHIFKDSGEGSAVIDRLSEDEKKFAVGYMDLTEDHFKKSFFSMLPKRVQILEKDGTADPNAGPNVDKFVFCRVRNRVGSYAVGEEVNDDSLDLNQGDILCIRYKSVQQLLRNEDIQLI